MSEGRGICAGITECRIYITWKTGTLLFCSTLVAHLLQSCCDLSCGERCVPRAVLQRTQRRVTPYLCNFLRPTGFSWLHLLHNSFHYPSRSLN
jgi:hypothetical protein